MGIEESAIEETVACVAIQRLLAAYADAVNRRAWDEFPKLFLDDAVIEITPSKRAPLQVEGAGELARFIAEAIEGFEFFQLVFLNSHFELQVAEGTATGRNFMVEMRQDRASGRWTRVFGVYHDRYRQVERRWQFEHRAFHALAATAGRDNHVFDFPAVD
ncbi:MAG: hypothetical protein CL908_12110 [Deltaproteobacteria bacterium]|jgi:hypothetical protein|nr:hypothetical protein [Deltaproteobacteria bacterium]